MSQFFAPLLLLTLLTLTTQISTLNHTCNGITAVSSSLPEWCPQYSGAASCCDRSALDVYFQTEIMICGQVLDHVSGCTREMRGLLCFGLCAVDNTTIAYQNEKSEIRVCHKYASGVYAACRGRLFCPPTKPDGTDNSKATCHTDTSSKDGCYNIGEYYGSAEEFINAKVDGFFGVNEDTRQAVGYKPKMKYVENDDETNMGFSIEKAPGACFGAASARKVAWGVVVFVAMLGASVAF